MTLKLKGEGMIKKSIKPHERYCRFCKLTNYLTVEDEFHFLMECSLYNSEGQSCSIKFMKCFHVSKN